MDIFTDVDIFKEIVEASTRGISVYILLDESNFSHFLTMTEKQGCQVQRLRVRILCFVIFFSQVFYFSQISGIVSYIAPNIYHVLKAVITEGSPYTFPNVTPQPSS